MNNAQQSGNEYGRAVRTTTGRDVAPVSRGEDIEPIGESRADVYMGNGEDEELLEAEIPSVRSARESEESHEYRETST